MRHLVLCLTSLAVVACKTDDPVTTDVPVTTDDTSSTGTTEGTSQGTSTDTTTDTPTSTTTTAPTTTAGACDGIMVPAIDEGSCTPLATDYQPRVNNSADDMWPACVSDTGPYTLVDQPPSTIARVVAYENMADLLWRKQDPSSDDFTAARNEYVLAEGLESRVVRREDLHYPPIPEAEWDPQVDPDKQCSVPALATKYGDRCVGPAKLQPLLDAEFAAGQSGDGDPNVHAAKIHAGLVWFLYLSTYKEANTCATVAPKDCDSAWAYYTGGEAIDAGIGMASEVEAMSAESHARIHDGVMAVRCWRDIAQDMDMYPLLDAVPQAQQDLFDQGWEQLDQALHRGFALVVRDHMQRYVEASCSGGDTAGSWAFLQIAGPVLDREAVERNVAHAKVLASLWQTNNPAPADVIAGIAALDSLFPCP